MHESVVLRPPDCRPVVRNWREAACREPMALATRSRCAGCLFGAFGRCDMAADFAVLVVEDDPLVRASMVSMFEEIGFVVFDTYNGSDALRLLSERPEIGLLFADVRMP